MSKSKFLVCYAFGGVPWSVDSIHNKRKTANMRAEYIAWRCPDYDGVRIKTLDDKTFIERAADVWIVRGIKYLGG